MHKRYLIGPDRGTVPEAHHGTLAVTASTDDQTEFWLPRATNLFNFSGITITQLRGTKKEDSHSRKVSVQVLGTSHKITTPKYRFQLIQTEAVGERRQPITLRVAVFEGAQAVTSMETITFDSSSDNIEGRKKSILLELRSSIFNKTTDYRLVLREVETEAEIESVPVIIDRSFDDDF